MNVLIKKTLRDLWSAKLRTILIILAISLSVGLGIGLVNATQNAYRSIDKRYEETNYEDIDIHFEMTRLDIGDIESIEGVRTAVPRLFIETQVGVGGKRYEAHWISAPFHPGKPYSSINGYQFFEGDYLGSETANETLVGKLFADARNVDVGDVVTVFYNNITMELAVSGIVGSPEYLYVVGDVGWPQPSLLCPMFTSYEMTAKALDLPPGSCNELLILVEDGYDEKEVKGRIEEKLAADGIRITRSVLGTEEADYLFARADADGMEKMGWAFGIIILAVTGVVIYNTMTRLIATQRPYIGVMQALGGNRTRILGHYAMFGLLLGIGGSILGIGAGIGISVLTIYAYADIVGLLSPDYTIYWIYPLFFGALAVMITTCAAFLGSLKVTRIGPREALSSQYQTQVFTKKPVIERLFDSAPGKRSILPRVPLRNLARHKLRTGITVIALAFSMILVFSTLALALGFDQPIEKNYSEYETWDVKVALSDHLDRGDIAKTLEGPGMEGIRGEPHLDDHVPVIVDKGSMKFVRVQAFAEDSNLRHYHVIRGKDDLSKGVLVGSILADDLYLKVGEDITFVIRNETSVAKVAGITGELMDDSIIMSLEAADEFLYTGGKVNSIIIEQGSLSRDEVESRLRNKFPVASFYYTEDVINGMESMIEGMTTMFYIFIGFGILAEVLFVSTTVVLNILDREMEFVSLRAMGARPGKIRRLVVSESLILLAGGLLIGLPLGLYITRWTMSYLVQGLMYYVLEVGISVYLITATIAFVATFIASFVSAMHITRTKLADTIRHRIIT